MEYRTLGRTGIRVSTIALGCEGFMHKTAEEVKADFDFAIENGINFVDIYSSNPVLRSHIGFALEGRRENFVIQGHLCTTWENDQYLRTRNPQKTIASFEALLKQLRTDYLDIGMIHYVDAEKDFHTVFDYEIIEIAQRLKAEGKIRAIGMSSHNPTVASIYTLCEREGVGIDVMKVYGGGDLLNKENSPFGRAMTPVQAIEYALTRPGVAAVMVGCKNREEIAEAVAWSHATPQERDYTAVMTGLEKFSWKGHCMYCGHCAPCTSKIDIAAVNKFYNLTVAQGEIPETVREHYKALTHHASECVECGACEVRCPFGVKIIESMHQAAQRFGF